MNSSKLFYKKIQIFYEDKYFLEQAIALIKYLNSQGILPCNKPLYIVEADFDYKMRDGESTSNSININVNGENKAITLAHEIGHYIDKRILNSTSEFVLQLHSSIYYPQNNEQQQLRSVIIKSYYYRKLQQLNKKGKVENYWLEPSELFARAFAQYITYKLKPYIEKNETKKNSGLCFLARSLWYDFEDEKVIRDNWCWGERDFMKVYNAFEKLFKQKG